MKVKEKMMVYKDPHGQTGGRGINSPGEYGEIAVNTKRIVEVVGNFFV